jgi:two-component system LytT family response regulator
LLKPVDIERLQQSVQKASNAVGLKETSAKIAVLNQTLKTNQLKNIIISDKGYQELIPINSIIAIEAQESYSQIHCESEKYIVSKNLKHYERIFEETNNFIRVHKSWIINCDHIINYSKSELTINLSNSLCAKLSKYKKADFEEYLAGEKVH